MESLPPPSQRQNMNTVPFVNQPLLSNQARMCLCASPCVCGHMSLGMLADEMECPLVCVCAHMFVGGRARVKHQAQCCATVYLFKCAMASKIYGKCACLFASVQGEEECPARVQLSKHVPVSCLPAPVTEK